MFNYLDFVSNANFSVIYLMITFLDKLADLIKFAALHNCNEAL